MTDLFWNIHSLHKILENFQKHFRCTIEGPDSSYSLFEIHIDANVDNELKMDPPIHTEYFRSGGAIIFTRIADGARLLTSLLIRSAMPLYMVVPRKMIIDKDKLNESCFKLANLQKGRR